MFLSGLRLLLELVKAIIESIKKKPCVSGALFKKGDHWNFLF